jgi:hypothetical protein
MAASRADIESWFNSGVAEGHTHMVVVCDTFDHEDFPAYFDSAEDAREKVAKPSSMERIMEVYYLKDPLDEQINQHRCFNYGPASPQTGGE